MPRDHDHPAARFGAVRARSVALAAPLSAEDACVQSMPDTSPTKWHLAHTTWFFETFVLEPFEPGFRPFDAAFRALFNSYYNGVGAKHPRPERGLLTRPALATVLDYRRAVDERVAVLLDRATLATAHAPDTPEILRRIELGLHHEEQHQELILTDLKHLLSCSPLAPAYQSAAPAQGCSAAPDLRWHEYAGGLTLIGHGGAGFAFDNEGPRHQVWLAPWALASRLTTNGEYADFIAAGGYTDPALWLAEGWDWVNTGQRRHPVYWRCEGQDPAHWQEFTLAGLQALDAERPVVHLSYYEADAYARWAGARLPTEFEWEAAAQGQEPRGHFADRDEFHPAAADATAAASSAPSAPSAAFAASDRPTQMYGDAWEWTSSSYAPYPGYRPAPGALGEYNGKFMVNQYVLRGGSCVTPPGHVRASYRNFFPAGATWQFSGVRLARDA